MMNYYKIIGTTLLIMMSMSLIAQRGNRAERIESLKVGYFTKKLDLSPQEAEKFWPVYNEMNSKVKEIRKSSRLEKGSLANLSEEEALDHINSRFDKEAEALDIKKSYYKKLIGTITARKLMKLTRVEGEFKKELLKEVQNRRRERGNR